MHTHTGGCKKKTGQLCLKQSSHFRKRPQMLNNKITTLIFYSKNSLLNQINVSNYL